MYCRTKLLFAALALAGVAVGLLLVSPVTAQNSSTSRVQGRVYDLWVSPSFAVPPYQPFHDCARFTETQMCLDGCGGSCGRLSEIPSGGAKTLWHGKVPCGGLNLEFTGVSYDGFGTPTGQPVMGGIGVGNAENSTFGVEGVVNPACVLPPPLRNPYAMQ